MANKNSNYPTTWKPKATPEEIGEMVQIMDGLRKLEPVSKNNPQAVEERLNYMFQYCQDNGIKPSCELMTLALGISRQAMWMWEKDETSKSGQLVRRAKEVINALITAWGMDSKVNPVYAIWIQKNDFGFADKVEHKLDNTSQEQIKEQQLLDDLSSLNLLWDEESGQYIPAGGAED